MDYPKDRILIISKSLTKFGITDKLQQAGILAVVSTESNFNLYSEMSYSRTPVSRLRAIFGHRLASYPDEVLLTLRLDNTKFFDVIYGGQQGNTAVGDGWKYRGRGFNQITFRNNYTRFSTMVGIDLVTNPDRLNETPVAADALAAYFKHGFTTYKVLVPTSLMQSTRTAFQLNAGWGTKIDENEVLRKEFAKQMDNVDDLYQIITTA